jgi:hypothetical protein
MKIHDWCCQGLSVSSRSQRRTVEAEIEPAMQRATISRASSGHDQRDSGVPVSAGSWQARALTSATCTGVKRRGRPHRLRSARAGMPPSAKRARQVRTVSRCAPVSRAIAALPRPRAACSTICARRRSRCGVLWP